MTTLLLPFASLVMLWDVVATAQRTEDDKLLTAAALRLQQYLSDGDASDDDGDLNEELYLAQSKQHGGTGVSVFEDSAWLRLPAAAFAVCRCERGVPARARAAADGANRPRALKRLISLPATRAHE